MIYRNMIYKDAYNLFSALPYTLVCVAGEWQNAESFNGTFVIWKNHAPIKTVAIVLLNNSHSSNKPLKKKEIKLTASMVFKDSVTFHSNIVNEVRHSYLYLIKHSDFTLNFFQ